MGTTPSEAKKTMMKDLQKVIDEGGVPQLMLDMNLFEKLTPYSKVPISGKSLEIPKGIMPGKLRTKNGEFHSQQ